MSRNRYVTVEGGSPLLDGLHPGLTFHGPYDDAPRAARLGEVHALLGRPDYVSPNGDLVVARLKVFEGVRTLEVFGPYRRVSAQTTMIDLVNTPSWRHDTAAREAVQVFLALYPLYTELELLAGRVKNFREVAGRFWLKGFVEVLGVDHHLDLVLIDIRDGETGVAKGAPEEVFKVYAGFTHVHEGRPDTVKVPGYDGDYALMIYPFTR